MFDGIKLELSGQSTGGPGFDHSGCQLTRKFPFLSYHQTCLYVRLRQVQESGGRGGGEVGEGPGCYTVSGYVVTS